MKGGQGKRKQSGPVGSGGYDRILWNRRPVNEFGNRGGDIDEVVLSDVNVHIEQMDGRCWWIGLYRADGSYWMGNFVADSRGRMRFSEQENNGIVWRLDTTHELEGQ